MLVVAAQLAWRARGESRPMLPDVASVEEFWIPLVDEPIGSIVARDPGGTSRRSPRWSTRRAACSRSARSPTSASGSCSGSCSSSNDVEPDDGSVTWVGAAGADAPSTTTRSCGKCWPWPRRSPPTRVRGRAPRAERRGAAALPRSSPRRLARSTAEVCASRRRHLCSQCVDGGSGSRFSWRWLVSSSCSHGAVRLPAAPARPRARRPPRWRSAWSCPASAGAEAGAITSPPTTPPSAPRFAYPADGSVVSTGRDQRVGLSDSGTRGRRGDEPGARRLSSSAARSRPRRSGRARSGSTRGRTARRLRRRDDLLARRCSAQQPRAAPNGRVELGDWGYARDARAGHRRQLRRPAAPGLPRLRDRARRPPDRAARQPARRRRDPDRLRRRRTCRRASAPATEADRPGPVSKRPEHAKPQADADRAGADQNGRSSRPLLAMPTGLQPQLTAGGYVFPVYGPVSYGDTFGAFRGDVAGNWHHGDDIFAPLGAPILAVRRRARLLGRLERRRRQPALAARLAGERVLLRAPLGVHAARAQRDARQGGRRCSASSATPATPQGTPYAPPLRGPPGPRCCSWATTARSTRRPYLDAWKHLQDVRFSNVAGWLPPATGIADPAPKPAAILLQVSDISAASGLEPGSLQRAMSARAARHRGPGATAVARAAD